MAWMQEALKLQRAWKLHKLMGYTECGNYTELLATVHVYFFLLPEMTRPLCNTASGSLGVVAFQVVIIGVEGGLKHGKPMMTFELMSFESPTPCESDAAVTAIDDLARQRELLEMLPLPTQNPSWRANEISAVFRISCDNRPFFVPCTFPVCLCHSKALALGVLFSPVSPSTPLLD